jgi:hypothetical protein
MTEGFRYSVYGLALDSNLELPGLAEGGGGQASLTVRGACAPDFAVPTPRPHFASDLDTLWHLDEERWLLRYDGCRMNAPPWFVEASEGGRRLDIGWSDPAQVEDIASFFPGPALALALHMRGAFLLHAGAVAVGARAALIMGPSGAGKSTTIAALLRRGYPLVTDDVAAVTDGPDGPAVHSGPRRLRLYAESAKAAGWDRELPRLFRHPALDDKRYLALDRTCAPASTMPIGAICLLRARDSARSGVGIERLAARDAFPALLANLYCGRFLDRGRAARAAARCAELAARVPVLAVSGPDRLDGLTLLVDELLGALARIW